MPSIKQAPPRWRVADVVRLHGDDVRRGVSLLHRQRCALDDIERCRTAALGGHRELYECGHIVTAYNSCRSRCCPQCVGSKSRDWVEQKEQDLLPIPYFHVVFTLPPELVDVPPMARPAVYEALFHAAGQTLLKFGRRDFGGQIGFLAVLHTWGQTLTHHPHVHCVVAGGAFNTQSKTWKSARPGFLFPVRALSKVFRGKMLAILRRRGLPGVEPERLAAIVGAAAGREWVVYAKRPFGGPEQVLRYLARYTHRIAIGEHRLVNVDDDGVTFTYRDYRDDSAQKTMTLAGGEFLRRYLQHVLPRGFTRLRSFGFLANNGKHEKLAAIRTILGAETPAPTKVRECLCPFCGVGVLVDRQLLEPWTLLPRRDTS